MLAFFAILVFFYTDNDKNKMNKENILKLVLLPNITIPRFSGSLGQFVTLSSYLVLREIR